MTYTRGPRNCFCQAPIIIWLATPTARFSTTTLLFCQLFCRGLFIPLPFILIHYRWVHLVMLLSIMWEGQFHNGQCLANINFSKGALHQTMTCDKLMTEVCVEFLRNSREDSIQTRKGFCHFLCVSQQEGLSSANSKNWMLGRTPSIFHRKRSPYRL